MTAHAEGGAPADATLAAAQALLGRTLGARVALVDVVRLTDDDRRNTVLRCRVVSDAGAPPSIIVKQVVSPDYRPDDAGAWDTQRFFRDWAGAELLTAVAPGAGHAPHFYGGDAAQGLILLEDLGAPDSLVEPLLGDDPARAEAALLRFAERLGQLHAATVGAAERFEQIVRAANPALPADVRGACRQQAGDFRGQAARLRDLLAQAGVAADPRYGEEIEEICAAIADPGDFLAYVHGDPCPDNALADGGRVRLIDFEFGQFGHALRDAAYGRMCFPTCWCASQLPAQVCERMEAAYRAALGAACPAARDQPTFEAALVRMCGFWLVGILGWHLEGALAQDETWGIASVRQRIVTRLQAFSEVAAGAGQLPGLAATAAALLAQLSQRWPDAGPLPLYPAFRA